MADRTRVLLVAAEPDDRVSTVSLRVLAEELDRRADVDCTVWYLRAGGNESWWPTARIVDDLRTWNPARLLDRLWLQRPAAHLRGSRLRRWLRDVDPDVILLDDGLGGRVVAPAARGAVVVARSNPVETPAAILEARNALDISLHVSPNPPVDGQGRWLAMPDLFDAATVQAKADGARAQLRDRGEVPHDVPLVVGWGGDGWVDGSDLFVRMLWHLEHRHGVEAHGLWLRTGEGMELADQLRAEAARCGVGDRLHLATDHDDGTRWAGDAVFLPYRVPAPPRDLLVAVVAGVEVVTFTPSGTDDPMVSEVPPLDLDAAAVRLAGALVRDRAEQARLAADRLGVAAWADRFLAATSELRT